MAELASRLREHLGADDSEELELLVALSAWYSGVDEKPVRLVGVVKHLTVQLQQADICMDEALDLARPDAHLMLVPHSAELVALGVEEVGDVSCARVGSSQRHDLTQSRGENPRQVRVVRRVVEPARRGVGEPPVADASRRSGETGRVAGEGDPEWALAECLPSSVMISTGVS